MNWSELKNSIYYWDGFCRDIYVVGSNRADWPKWVDYVNEHHCINWFNGKANTYQTRIDLDVIKEFWSGNHGLCSTAKVFIGNTQLNTHFFFETELENDIDPREFNSMEDHKRLIEYMSNLSTLLNKVVILTPENEHHSALIKVAKSKITYSRPIVNI